MNSRIPLLIFIAAVAGVAFLAWHSSQERLNTAKQRVLATELSEKHTELLERVTELESKRIVTRTEFKNIEIQEPVMVWKQRSIGPLKTKVPEVIMKRRTIKVPNVVTAEDPKIVQEVDAARSELLVTQQALAGSQPSVSLSQQLFGIRREIAAFIFSVAILVASLYVIINKRFRATTEKWAYGSVGTILGYWLG